MIIREAQTPTDYIVARALIEEYAAALGVDLCFQGFERELADLSQLYGPPKGCLLLAHVAEDTVGCVAVRHLREDVCEMKRLFVRPDHRGVGTGRRLVAEAMSRARQLGYRAIVLDTLPSMTVARSLYRSLGFNEVAAYYANPLPGVEYLRADL